MNHEEGKINTNEILREAAVSVSIHMHFLRIKCDKVESSRNQQ